MVRNDDEGGQAKVVWTCHEERTGVRRKKGDGNRVTRKGKKREAKEKIFGCSEGGYERSWCEGDKCWKQGTVEHHMLWQPLI